MASEYNTSIGISQICERDGLLAIDVATMGMPPIVANSINELTDNVRSESALICEICGAEGMRIFVGGAQKTLCLGHAIHALYECGE
jgi:hypothetical protein